MAGFPLDKWRGVQLVNIDPNVSTFGKVVYSRLMSHHNTKTGRCYPSEATLAHALNCTERSIRTALKCLAEHKYIRISRGKGRNGTNQYTLAIPSGKNEYDKAEKLRLSQGKKPSAKPMNKPLKEQEREKARVMYMSEKRQRNNIDENSGAKKQGNLHRKVVERFDNESTGWELLQSIDTKTLQGIENQYLEDDKSLNSAVELLLNATRCVE
jgi:hypothetical protein